MRHDGVVPGIVYGRGEAARPFQVGARELRAFMAEGHALFDLEIEGSKGVPVVVKEQQRHPVRGELVHLDLLEVDLEQEITAPVEVVLQGADEAPGAKEGGVLEHVTREVEILALPADIPESLVADVSAMDINDTLNLNSVPLPAGVKLTTETPEEVTIATLSPPRVEEEPEPEVEEEAELVGEEGAEEEAEAGEGAEAPEEGGGEEAGEAGDEG
jgi:large subunit ribosomal protein L25